MEVVFSSNKILVINDSKATNGVSTAAALLSYDNIYWIAGGLSKTNGIKDCIANLKNVVSLSAPESTNRVKVIRNGTSKSMKVTLQELPENPQQFAGRQNNSVDDFGLRLSRITDSLKKKYEIEEEEALVVTKIDPNGEAYEKGIREGDLIKRVGTEKVTSVKEFERLIKK